MGPMCVKLGCRTRFRLQARGTFVYPAPMSSLSLHRVTFILTALCFAFSIATSASAQEPVDTHVETFEGTGADEIEEMVTAAVQEDARVRIVGNVGAHLQIGGSVSGRGARRSVQLTARSSSGAELAQENARLGRGAAGRRAVTTAVQNLLEAALGNLAVEASLASAEPSSTEAEPETETEAETEHAQPSAPQDSLADPAILSVAIGTVIRTRDTEIRLMNGGQQTYGSGAYWEATARVELRPLAHEQGLARGLFLRLDYAHALGLGSRDTSGAQYETVYFRAYGDVGFLFGLGDVVELGAAVGFGWDAYKIATNPILPGVEYPFLRPAVRLRVRLLQELVVLDADIGFRSIFSRANFNGFGASGDSFGLDAGLGIGGLFDFGLLWRANFSWSNYWHSFSGTSTLMPGTSGTDGGIQVGLTVGYGRR